ncbi:MAG: 50S ribosomal protein L1 [Patescibacteria group bacterium]|nr:50S ribosomal protein L1 [Patescibacteria group bacterium]
MSRSRKYQEIKNKIKPQKLYSLEEAIDFIKENKTAKFDESIEVHLRLSIDPNKPEQHLKGSVVLPFGLGKSKKIICFVEPEKEKEAKEAGADEVGGKELIEKIKTAKKLDFDVAVASPQMMRELAPIAKILGPKGLMPSPKQETVTEEIGRVIKEIKKGKIYFKNDEGGNLHQVIGKTSWPREKIITNFKTFLEAVKKSKPPSLKGNFIRNVVICSTMGPALKIKL